MGARRPKRMEAARMPLISKIKRNGVSALLTLGACMLMGAGVVMSTAWTSPPPGGNENSQKVTICHATGSESNPFVEITVDEAAIFEAHGEHQNDRDIIPAFTFVNSHGQTVTFAGQNWDANGRAILANDCKVPHPSPSPTPTPTPTKSHGAQKVTVCHATGSDTNPFVEITVDVAAILEAHSEHQNEQDIIPPFTFVNAEGETIVFAGQNFDAQGQLIFSNDCKIQAAPSPTPSPTPTVTPTQTPTSSPTVTPMPSSTATSPSGAAAGAGTVTPAGMGAGVGAGAGGGAGAGAGAGQSEVSLSAQTSAGATSADNTLSLALFGSGLFLLLGALLTRLAKSQRGRHV